MSTAGNSCLVPEFTGMVFGCLRKDLAEDGRVAAKEFKGKTGKSFPHKFIIFLSIFKLFI